MLVLWICRCLLVGCKSVVANMEFRTVVQVDAPGFLIEPLEPILFVGSCFADHIGRRFSEEHMWSLTAIVRLAFFWNISDRWVTGAIAEGREHR